MKWDNQPRSRLHGPDGRFYDREAENAYRYAQARTREECVERIHKAEGIPKQRLWAVIAGSFSSVRRFIRRVG